MTATTMGARVTRWARLTGWRHLLLVVALVFALFPVLFVVSAALNPLGTLSSSSLVPQGVSTANLERLFSDTPFGSWYLNSILISLANAAGTVFLCALAAYAFSRFRFIGRRTGLFGLLLVQMFPQFLAIVAIYLMFTDITEYWPEVGFDTPWGLMLVYLGGALSVNTWLMKGFFDTVPRELDESARVDGATHAQVFFRIMLPLVAPVLAIVGLLVFISTINEFLIASVFLRDPESKTVALGLYGLISGERNANFGIFAAGTLLISLPTMAVFWFLQRFIVEGLTSGAVKG
ncbi:sugar ABC transporter permease [Marinactinospora thermotolerans]|uniref:Carbohydrate ABC transporter membrane protein 2, CUT1 family n=1 Tax=Marinactinospora thermotolerans DSM 45154 TaxID=1122192 RepID=A0A1T4LLX6_9ACTN|nr:sugar ABC transporter permease [Marinactinospora thermotolerans]SJZ55715.1 carbohydrate ABC transporter membrane protein 2, CUT1 family [Marinactinospora thermotolerans DSM 45154]